MSDVSGVYELDSAFTPKDKLKLKYRAEPG